VESWITKAKADEPLDTLTPPSESYDREEVVVLIGQDPQGNITHLLPIHRLGNGKFWNLGDDKDMPADSFEGRFAGMLPPKPADEKTRQMGKVLLEAMGVVAQAVPWTKEERPDRQLTAAYSHVGVPCLIV